MLRITAEKLLLLLVIVSIAALPFREPLLEERVIIDSASNDIRFTLDSDVQDGGSTVTEWLDQENLAWRCILGEAYDFPFCGMQMYFSDTYLHVIDLTNYTHINLW